MIRNILFYIIAFQFYCFTAQALSETEDHQYRISDIPEPLLVDAHTVVRRYDWQVSIESLKTCELEVVKAISVVGSFETDASILILPYNKSIRIKSLKASIYDKVGRLVETIKGNDILDFSNVSEYSIYEDVRRKIIDPNIVDPPYTVEYAYKIELKSGIYLPAWIPVEQYHQSLEQASYRLQAPAGFKVKYLEKYLNNELSIDTHDGQTQYHWHIESIPAFREELFSSDWPGPMVYAIPEKFQLEGIEGSFESWQSVGEWITRLNQGKQNLSEETKRELRIKTRNANSPYDKIDRIYRHMQDKVRYVNIVIGIGGLQPYDAETVERLSYGDCKALSNYMMSCLEAVDIPSYYTIIDAGRNSLPIETGFPSNQFNHAMLCVPLDTDTLWLECTNQLIPTAYTGSFTDDRHALLIDGSKSKLVKTKAFSPSENSRIGRFEMSVSDDQTTIVKYSTIYKGSYYDQMYNYLVDDDQDINKRLLEEIPYSPVQSLTHSFDEVRSKNPSIHQELSFAIDNFGTQMGNRIFLPLVPFNQIDPLPVNTGQRHTDIFIKRSSCEKDTIRYTIPEAYYIEKKPEPFEQSCAFGSYKLTLESKADQLIIYRHFEKNKGLFPKEDEDILYAFYEAAARADQSLFLLKAKE